ncbi:putative mRNA-binding protein CTH1 KNAG_0A05120 [Huiozyma naganishii CBS 8797]|uniref:C3H1-type domain-containing protein n=1 Tax=Huiozyma naganishii (strain ATCC MYA-139 / BCRC 22969 / CBS 8797 / KCTC 17520 / NBRC 10181 / NCYC 3082 / Yp74L-3) TaxID=1071383 RepID=J7S2H5_HUIN7|nr:hypothetical protein KNAG_0A05120 [Kazachstania naganishii CBS 8797]CCK68179.1 hypothetical protein KNAG_0A05120 [Kazachstania naganishii CBS 8797]
MFATTPGNHYTHASWVTSDTASSVFSHENDELDCISQIKDIEEYYLKTLLSDDNDDDGGVLLSKQLQQQQAIASHTRATTSVDPFQPRQAERLEVAINANFYPHNLMLPLTTENLQKLTLAPASAATTTTTVTTPQSPETVTKRKRHHSQGSSCAIHHHHPQQQQQQQQVNKQLYKTELCESFTTKGFCKYGNKCQFAHGLHELNFKTFTNNFRTKPCNNWQKLGYCPYGKRCRFKHGDNRDIQIYVKAGTYLASEGEAEAEGEPALREQTVHRPKNLNANVKRLQRITW